MGQVDSSIQKQISLENINSDANSKHNHQRKNSSMQKEQQIHNNKKDMDDDKQQFPNRRFSRKSSKAHSVRLKYFKTSESNNNRGSSYVELIVRKKLITTTTTTTMHPGEINNNVSNGIMNSQLNDGEKCENENESDIENKVTMKRVVI